ncbi:hypothetical protein ABZ128_16925 [Streptomyces sp. NPDC006326]|uniref:hypothetical protein n=1 Tax=Streptomyces sp. NPDC006326 TaxID=3156752 RepID=UPI0033BBB88E
MATAAAVLLATLVCGGCASSGHGDGRGHGGHGTPASQAAAPAARPAGLQDLAAALGCTPEITVDAEELREGACGTGQEAFRMATFAADQGQRAWLDEAMMYGGTYLVGTRWVVTGPSAQALSAVQGRLGGTLATGSTHGAEHGADHGSPPASPAASPPGSGPGSEPAHGPSHGSAPMG